MNNKRIIARLDIKLNDLIKGVRMEGWRKLGDPIDFANHYYKSHIDEIILLDVVASLYERNNLRDIVASISENIHIPICVGGGIRSKDDVSELLKVGADKVTLNTAVTKNPILIKEISDTFGSQATVVCLECKKNHSDSGYELLTDNGRNKTGIEPAEWATKAQELGAGEIYLVSIDQDGTAQGCDLNLLKDISARLDIPVIGGGGVGSIRHVEEAFNESQIQAISIGYAFHKKIMSIPDLKENLRNSSIEVREKGL